MNAICLIVDGLQAGWLGPYGNSWVATPACNRMAAEGYLFDQAYVDSPRLESVCRSLWAGRHAMVKPAAAASGTLAETVAAAGFHSMLITDDRLVAEHPLAGDFRQSLFLRPPTRQARHARLADDINGTELALFFAEAIDHLPTLREPFLLWVHSRGLTGAWDAPWSLRERYLEQEEDATETNLESRLAQIWEPPAIRVADEPLDADELLALRMVYAAQVETLDLCLAAWMQALQETAIRDRTLITLLGARGFPLGQHRNVGIETISLHEELIHIPWLISLPAEKGVHDRTSSFVQPADLAPTILDFLEVKRRAQPRGIGEGRSMLPLLQGRSFQNRDRLLISDEACANAIRTSGWYLIQQTARTTDSAGELSGDVELYVKPDDRWEMNEVASRCPELTPRLTAALEELKHAVAENVPNELTPLDASLQSDLT